jgi:hypothetical protein
VMMATGTGELEAAHHQSDHPTPDNSGQSYSTAK